MLRGRILTYKNLHGKLDHLDQVLQVGQLCQLGHVKICIDTFDTFGTFLQNVNNTLFFRLVTVILILVNHGITIKKIESAKSVKSVMSFFYYTSQAFSDRKSLYIPYILFIHSLFIVLIISLLCT